MMLRSKRGMGVVHPADCDTGNNPFCTSATDCSVAWMWALAPQCWTTSLSDWQALAALPQPPPPLVTVPAAPTQAQLNQVAASPDPGAAAQALANQLAADATNATIVNSQQQNTVFMSNLSDLLAQQQPQNSDTPDCSGFFAFLNSACAPTTGISIPYWVWLLVGGVGAVIVVKAVR